LTVSRLAPVAAVGLLLILMVVSRGPDLVTPSRMNPDEAELLAEGRRAALELTPYRAFTASTHLALWPMFMGVLAGLGIPMVLPLAHVLSGLAYLWLAFAGWLVAARRFGWLLPAVAVLPPALVLMIGPDGRIPDFRSLGTELLPVSLIVLGGVVLFWPSGVPTRRRLAVACVLAGLAVWAKPQTVVLAAALCVVGFLMRRLAANAGDRAIDGSDAWRDAATVVGGFIAPTVVFVLWMAVAGTLDRFLDEPVAYISSYLVLGIDPTAGYRPSPLDRAAGVAEQLGKHLAELLWLLPGVFAVASIWRGGSRRARALGLAMLSVPVLASLFTLAVQYPVLPHYMNILYGGVVLSSIAGLAVAGVVGPVGPVGPVESRPVRDWRALRVAVAAGLIGAFALGGVLRFGTVQRNASAVLTALAAPPPPGPTADSAVARACPAGSRVLVWGWASELFSEFDWQPASRFVNSWPLLPWGKTEVYRATMMEEITSQPPRCVVEAVGLKFFGRFSAADAISLRMPELAAYLATCYRMTVETLPGERPVTLWQRPETCPTVT
jgi:hypothetical protein